MTHPDPWKHDTETAAHDGSDPLIDAVRRDVDGHHHRPHGLLDRHPHVVCWPALTVEAAEAELHTLANWVEWLVGRYSLDHRTVPPCWHEHGALVEELSALHSLWQACYGPDASPADPTNFQQHLSLALMRLRDWAARRDCKPGNHRDDQPPIWHRSDNAD